MAMVELCAKLRQFPLIFLPFFAVTIKRAALKITFPSHILATPPGILYNRVAGWVELSIQC